MKYMNNFNSNTLVKIDLLLFVYSYLFFWFFDKIFVLIFILFGIPFFAIFVVYILDIILSIIQIKKNYKNIINWLPLLLLIVLTIIFCKFNPSIEKIKFDYQKNYVDRSMIVEQIKLGKLEVEENKFIRLPNKYKKLSNNGIVYIYLNDKNDILVSFTINTSLPNGSSNIVYTSGGINLINQNIKSIDSIQILDNNWYYVKVN